MFFNVRIIIIMVIGLLLYIYKYENFTVEIAIVLGEKPQKDVLQVV